MERGSSEGPVLLTNSLDNSYVHCIKMLENSERWVMPSMVSNRKVGRSVIIFYMLINKCLFTIFESSTL